MNVGIGVNVEVGLNVGVEEGTGDDVKVKVAVAALADVKPKAGIDVGDSIAVWPGNAGRLELSNKTRTSAMPVLARLFMPLLILRNDLHELRDHITQHAFRKSADLAMHNFAA